jgi:hypothetical protein
MTRHNGPSPSFEVETVPGYRHFHGEAIKAACNASLLRHGLSTTSELAGYGRRGPRIVRIRRDELSRTRKALRQNEQNRTKLNSKNSVHPVQKI